MTIRCYDLRIRFYVIPLPHKLSLAIFVLNGHQANNKNIILSQGVQNLCFYRAY